MIGFTKKVAVVPLQSEANANYNPFPDATNVTDIQAIKTAFLADQDVLEALKGSDGQQGQQGPQGQTGPAGDSVIVRDTDPTDAVSSKVGDLYLNSTSGTLYQRSGITQSQFYAAGLQGLVLPNSIWIRKGNLKGAIGEKGDKGDGIINGLGHPSFAVQTLPPVGTLYINKNTFMMYERSATEYIPGNVPGELPEDYTLGYWYALGSLKGVNGTDGMDGNDGQDGTQVFVNENHLNVTAKDGDLCVNTTNYNLYKWRVGVGNTASVWQNLGNIKGANGKDAFEVLQGTGTYMLTNEQIGKTLIINSDSAITGLSYNNVTIAGSTVFLSKKSLPNSVGNTPSDQNQPQQLAQVFADDYFVIENYSTPVSGYWFSKTSLKGTNGSNGFTEVVKGYFNFSAKVTVSAQARKTGVTPSTSMGASWDSNKYVRNSLELIVNNKVIVVSEYDTAPAGGMLYALDDYRAYLHVTAGELYFSSTWEASGGNYPVDSGRSYVKYLSK